MRKRGAALMLLIGSPSRSLTRRRRWRSAAVIAVSPIGLRPREAASVSCQGMRHDTMIRIAITAS